jgi:hypothetical protein
LDLRVHQSPSPERSNAAQGKIHQVLPDTVTADADDLLLELASEPELPAAVALGVPWVSEVPGAGVEMFPVV